MAHEKWRLEDIRSGFDRFYQENGRMPTANEVDFVTYLPSTRRIEQKFGGLIKVRKILGYKDYHLGAGVFRSKIAKRVNKSGLKFEQRVELLLIKKFGEPFVHVQKRVGKRKNSIDFLIFTASKKFGVDVVSTNGLFRDLQTNVNIKLAKYESLPFEIIIVIESKFSQKIIDKWIDNKITPFFALWRVFTFENFIEYINKLKPYTVFDAK